MGSGADHRKSHAPPHEDLPQIIRVAGVFPQPHADEGGGTVFAIAVHLYVSDALQGSRAYRKAEEQDTAHIGGQSLAEGVDGGEDTAVDHQGGHHVDAHEIDDGVENPRLFTEHGIPPILVSEVPEGVRPVGGEADGPVANRDEEQDTQYR